MASFEPRGLGIEKEMYSRKSYSGVSVSIGDNFKIGTTERLARDQHPSQTVTDGLSLITGDLKLRFPLPSLLFSRFRTILRTLHLHPHAFELPFLHPPDAVKSPAVQRPSKSFNYLRA
jgi:hypothetical protein